MNLWTTASEATVEVNHRKLFASLRVEAVEYWPFLAEADNTSDFNNRLALISSELDRIVRSRTSDGATYLTARAELEASFVKDFETITAARKTAGDPGWISHDPDWWENKNKGGYGMPNSHPFWSEVKFEDIGQWRVFEKDGTWYAMNRKQNAWLDPKSRSFAGGGRQAIVDYVNQFNEKPVDIWASKTAAEKCTVCGKPATKYVGGQEGYSASGHHVCDTHADHFNKSSAKTARTPKSDECPEGCPVVFGNQSDRNYHMDWHKAEEKRDSWYQGHPEDRKGDDHYEKLKHASKTAVWEDECYGCGHRGTDWKGGGYSIQCPKCGSYEVHGTDKSRKESAHTATLVPGKDLNSKQRNNVLNAFPYRWTHENRSRTQAWGSCPKCDISKPYENSKSSEGHSHPTIPLQHDDQWLKEHAFHMNKRDELSGNHRGAEPHYARTASEDLTNDDLRELAAQGNELAAAMLKVREDSGRGGSRHTADGACSYCADNVKDGDKCPKCGFTKTAAYNPFSDPQSSYNNPDKGPHDGVPHDLFPDGGVPLRGDLTAEQSAWLEDRDSKRSLMLSSKTAGPHGDSRDIIGYTYDADVHCPGCALARFGQEPGRHWVREDAEDSEGNPVHPIAPWDETSEEGEHCADCGEQIREGVDGTLGKLKPKDLDDNWINAVCQIGADCQKQHDKNHRHKHNSKVYCPCGTCGKPCEVVGKIASRYMCDECRGQ